MKYSWLFLLLTLVFTVCTKRKKGDTFPEHVTLRITVKDKTGAVRPGAKVVLYTTLADYTAGVADGNIGAGQKQAIADANGMVTLDTVEANIEQWLLVTLYDSSKMVLLSNKNLSSTLSQLLPGSVIDMEVTIEPLSANVAFFTTSTVNLPVYIKLGPNIRDTLTVITTNPLSIEETSTDALIIPISEGVYSYQAYVDAGCTWTGSLDIKNGDFPKIPLDPCQLAKVTFYFYDTTSTPVMNVSPFEVYVDNVLQGTLTSIYPNGPIAGLCGLNVSGSTVTAYVESGVSHTYRVRANGSVCTWISSVPPLTPGQCFEVAIQKIPGNNCP